MNLRVLSETATTVTVGWDAVPDAVGFDFYVDEKRVSFTHDGTRTQVKFGKPDANPHVYEVRAWDHFDSGALTVPTPAPPPPAQGAFMSYPASQPITGDGAHDIEVLNLSFRGFHQNVLAFQNCRNIHIHDCDFDDCGGTSNAVIYLYNCTGTIKVEACRFRQPGFHAIQLNGCTVGGYVRGCKVKGAARTEDIISLYASGGNITTPFAIEDNQLEGGDWQSGSGSGIMVGDNGGQHIVVRNNHLLNPGAVGIGVAGGSDILVNANTIYGKQMPLSNVGVYAWHQNGPPSTDVALTNNKVDWRNAAGQRNGWWNGPNTPVTQSGNEWNAVIDPATLAVTL